MCAFFLLTAGAAANSVPHLHEVAEYDEEAASPEEKKKAHWAQKIEEDTAYRTKEFRRLLKRLKAASSAHSPPEDAARTQYRLTLHWDQRPFADHQVPKDKIQMMLFGTQGYLSPTEFTFVPDEDEKAWHMEGTWEGQDIGTVEALSIGYDHGTSNSLFIEYFTLQKCSLDGECREEYNIPLYRWLSSQRDDGSSYRVVWVHPAGQPLFDADNTDSEPLDDALAQSLHLPPFQLGRPRRAFRKVRNPQVHLKRYYIEHCISFETGKLGWRQWMRYDTFAYFNTLIDERFPELYLDSHFPGKVPSILGMSSTSDLLERQEGLDRWSTRVLLSAARCNDRVVQAFANLPPRTFFDETSPLLEALIG